MHFMHVCAVCVFPCMLCAYIKMCAIHRHLWYEHACVCVYMLCGITCVRLCMCGVCMHMCIVCVPCACVVHIFAVFMSMCYKHVYVLHSCMHTYMCMHTYLCCAYACICMLSTFIHVHMCSFVCICVLCVYVCCVHTYVHCVPKCICTLCTCIHMHICVCCVYTCSVCMYACTLYYIQACICAEYMCVLCACIHVWCVHAYVCVLCACICTRGLRTVRPDQSLLCSSCYRKASDIFVQQSLACSDHTNHLIQPQLEPG